MKQMLNAMDNHRPVLPGDVEHALVAQQVLPVEAHQAVEEALQLRQVERPLVLPGERSDVVAVPVPVVLQGIISGSVHP